MLPGYVGDTPRDRCPQNHKRVGETRKRAGGVLHLFFAPQVLEFNRLGEQSSFQPWAYSQQTLSLLNKVGEARGEEFHGVGGGGSSSQGEFGVLSFPWMFLSAVFSHNDGIWDPFPCQCMQVTERGHRDVEDKEDIFANSPGLGGRDHVDSNLFLIARTKCI